MWFDTTDVKDKYLASLGVDNKLIFFHIWEAKVDYFVERKIKHISCSVFAKKKVISVLTLSMISYMIS